MAKPGTPQAKALSRAAAFDLQQLRKPKIKRLAPAIAAQVLAAAEMEEGLRCAGCGRRISEGWQFARYEAAEVNGKPSVQVERAAGCSGEPDETLPEGCNFSAVGLSTATVAEVVQFTWPLGDAPAPLVPEEVKRGERLVFGAEEVAEMARKALDDDAEKSVVLDG